MIPWINLAALLVSTGLCLLFYVKSAGPASLEIKIGPAAYAQCTRYRALSGLFMTTATVSYVVAYFYPLPIPLPQSFPWSWSVSAGIAVLIAIPGGYLWIQGMKDAGEETMIVKKEHVLYQGIYEKIRHPQAVGELSIWWVIALLLNSPFLALYSVVWIPVFFLMCRAEERDLVIRYGQAYLDYQARTGFVFPKRGET